MNTDMTFADLGVPAPLVGVLAERGITHPFPIQVQTLPDTLAGRDVLGRGKTGSGKTLAFSIPLASRLSGNKRRPFRPSGLVLAPTRELATQITTTLKPLAAANDLRVTAIFGGVPQTKQVAALKSGIDIVVACPGRLEDLMKQRLISLDAVEITVIDEADHMADLGFLPGVTRILAATPSVGQRLLFSATLDNGVDNLVNRFLRDEVLHSVDELNTPVSAMTHHVFHVAGVEAKKELVHRLASGTGRRILFMRTKHHARKLAKQLTESGIPSVDLHGNLSQPARDRNLAAFTAGEARVLVATDIGPAWRARRRSRAGGPHRSAERTQGVSASVRAHGAGRKRRRRRHRGVTPQQVAADSAAPSQRSERPQSRAAGRGRRRGPSRPQRNTRQENGSRAP